jgi:predicted peptidase
MLPYERRPFAYLPKDCTPMLRYIVSAPSAQRTPLPLLCFLHGYGEAAPMPLERALRRHGPLASSAAAVASREFILLAPQLPHAGDIWRRYADDVRDVVSGVCARHAVDNARMYLTGFSYGGNGVFDLALAQPDLWAALWPADPTRVPRQVPPQPLWLSAGDVARAQKREFVQALVLGERDTRSIWFDDGADHVGSARAAYGDERIYRWLLQHTH